MKKLSLICAFLGSLSFGSFAFAQSPAGVICEGNGARVVVDSQAKTATYTQDNNEVGTASCFFTAMAGFNLRCSGPDFSFLFASIPGPTFLHGNSAELITQSGTTLLPCHY